MTLNQINLLIHRRFGWLANRYPVVTHWLANRLTTDQFTGLPLTVLIGLLFVNMLTLSEIAENIVKSEPMVQVDQQVTDWLFQIRSSQLSRLLYGVTALGSQPFTIGVTVVSSAFLLWQRRQRNALILWLMMGGLSLSVQVGKRIFDRPRPLHVAYYPVTGFSFPSGHSATAMILYGLLAYWWIRQLKNTRAKIGAGLGAASLILTVGFSRIYLGVHFLSDVLGGYLLGIAWLIVGIVLTEWQRTQKPAETD